MVVVEIMAGLWLGDKLHKGYKVLRKKASSKGVK